MTLYAVLSDGRQLNTIKQTFGNMLNKIWQCLKRLFVLCWECFNFSNFFSEGWSIIRKHAQPKKMFLQCNYCQRSQRATSRNKVGNRNLVTINTPVAIIATWISPEVRSYSPCSGAVLKMNNFTATKKYRP